MIYNTAQKLIGIPADRSEKRESVLLSASVSVLWSLCLSVLLSVSLSVCLTAYLPICLRVQCAVCANVCLVYLLIYPIICLVGCARFRINVRVCTYALKIRHLSLILYVVDISFEHWHCQFEFIVVSIHLIYQMCCH